MEKDENINIENKDTGIEKPVSEGQNKEFEENSLEKDQEVKQITPEEKIKELEDKITRTFAEMENQRRRFEKEREDAFSYGGFAFAKEILNLIDNFERSKLILKNDECHIMKLGNIQTASKFSFPSKLPEA